MSDVLIFVIVAAAILVIGVAVGLVAFVNGRKQPPRRDLPSSAPSGTITEERPPEVPEQAPVTTLERPEGTAGRLVRLRQRLSRSQGGLGRGLLMLLSRDRLDEDTWEEIEDTLITADVGVAPTQELVERLRTRMRVEAMDASTAPTVLREELIALVDPSMDRRLGTDPSTGSRRSSSSSASTGRARPPPSARSRASWSPRTSVVLGAADTFRAAATEQLSTWAERVGVDVVTGPEGSDPASVAFESVRAGVERGVDVVVIDTAGRLQNKAGLMDELGKVKRVVEKQAPVSEVLLVLDATTGQNGLVQARVFRDVVDVTGIVLTKLDGSAKGGIVVAVQRELGVPVKLVGVGEGADDLAPFDPETFVDALLG